MFGEGGGGGGGGAFLSPAIFPTNTNLLFLERLTLKL